MENNLEVKNISKYELYEDLMNEMKTRLTIDQGTLDTEVLNLLADVKQEIIALRTGIDTLQLENQNYKNDCCIMARQIYVNEQLENVKSETARKKITQLLLIKDADVINYDKADLDRIIMEIDNG